MKITIDTCHKIIQLDGAVNLGELVKTLSSMFPDFSWEEYTLGQMVITIDPGMINIPYYPQPGTVPLTNPPWIITCNSDKSIFTAIDFIV